MSKIKPIYKPFDILKNGVWAWREAMQKQIDEANKAEDDDVVVIEDVPEELPKCKNKQEFDEYLEEQIIERLIRYINVHCSGTHINATGSGMLRYWRENRGWRNPGYDILIYTDGSITIFTDWNTITNGVAGVNSISLNVCTVGGLDENKNTVDTRTQQQKEMLHYVLEKLHAKATEALRNAKTKPRWTHVEIKGHRDHPNVRKACPCYDAIPEFEYISLS